MKGYSFVVSLKGNVRSFGSSAQFYPLAMSTAAESKGKLTMHNSIVAHKKDLVVGKRCWETPLKRKITWMIIAPDARITSTSYRNEPEMVCLIATPSNFLIVVLIVVMFRLFPLHLNSLSRVSESQHLHMKKIS